ncbi:fatty acyl-AMP ligase [Micromonospora sp. NPDC049044]|uniref:fatty acyl-AMP ligase n=1 Tax=Micromonospora sp. NPDC049044 TaxID=3154827 RepID=UPI0033F73882
MAELPRCPSAGFAHVLRTRARESAASLAFRFVLDDGHAEEITYGELDRRARAVAINILDVTDGRPERALLLYPPGLDYLTALFACFYAGTVAIPAFPPGATRQPRTMSRLMAIIEDAGASLVLTTSPAAPMITDWLADSSVQPVPRVVSTDLADPDAHDLAPRSSGDTLAVLQYTSGSTSLPRGVMLNHDHLISNTADITRSFGLHAGASAVFWLPPYHDMGLIGGLLTPVASGIPATFMSPVTFLRRPLSWMRVVSRYRATHTGGPNFAYDLCVKRVKESDLVDLDLSSVELSFTGAEPVRPDTIERFLKIFEPYGLRPEAIYPCYGLAEATLLVSGGTRLGGWRSVSVAREALELARVARPATAGEPSRRIVGCGAPGPGTRIEIVDPTTGEPVPPGQVGEIWLDSPSVAAGYWRRPSETAETFGALTASGEGPYLRTGDLGFVADGELFVAGRAKDLIVLNGRNYHPVDIEQICETDVAGIRRDCGAAFAVEDDHGAVERLVVVYEVDPGMTEDQHLDIIDGIRRCVSRESSVAPSAIVLIKARTMPKTSSGKVQRWLARRQYLSGELAEVTRWQRLGAAA